MGTSSGSSFRAFALILSLSCLGGRVTAESDVIGSEQVAEVMKTFEGRGTLGDGSEPTSPLEAVTRLKTRDDIEVDLVLSEPDIEQPLSLAWDSRGRLWVVQYRQYQFPAGLRIIEYDNHLRARFDKVPAPPPDGTPGADVISVFEDTDGDGRLDSKKDVISGLNIATSVAIGAGGLWVANPPYLLFYPDGDGDDLPDSDPMVKLSGFGLEDTHSVMNSLTWGPDGWLYGANGSTTTGKVKDPASGELVEWLGQMIWRYHPETEEFEIYAEGGGNTFSLDIDAKGRVFSGTNNGKTRGMFYPQGSYGKKSWGKHGPLTNPYAFGYFHHMKHEGDDRRFAQAFVIEEGGLFEDDSSGRIVAPNALHNVVWSSRLERDGSTYRTVDELNLVETEDRWFRPVYAGLGPDGAVYLADWYDTRLSHVSPIDDWHKSSGRVYRLRPKGSELDDREGDLRAKSSDELIDLFSHSNRTLRRRALLELGWRGDLMVVSRLEKLIEKGNDQEALEALWALNLLGALDQKLLIRWLNHDDTDIRRWCVRLIGDRRLNSEELREPLRQRAESEPDIQVRVQLAATAKRLSPNLAVPVIAQLTKREEDLNDLHQPLMIWWAMEAQAEKGREELFSWLEQSRPWRETLFREALAGRLMRRYAMAGGENNLRSCERLLALAPDAESSNDLLEALQLAYEGIPIPQLPNKLAEALTQYAADLGETGLVIRLRQNDRSAIKEALKAVTDESLPVGVRTELIRGLQQVEGTVVIPTLFKLFGVDEASAVKRVALQTLASFDDLRVPEGIIKRYGSTLPDSHGVRNAAEMVLASRADWAELMLDQVDRAVIKNRDVSPEVVMLLMQHSDPKLVDRVQKHWPGIALGGGGLDLEEESKRIKTVLMEGQGEAEAGQVIFATRCVACHKLFKEGGEIGPDLTGYERDNLDFWIHSIVNPSLELREGYLNYVARMKDGRTVMGLMHEQSPKTVSLKDHGGQIQLLNRGEMESLSASPLSLMPSGLLEGLDEQELRDFFAYLTKK